MLMTLVIIEIIAVNNRNYNDYVNHDDNCLTRIVCTASPSTPSGY